LFVTVNPSDTLWPELFRRVVGVDEERRLDKRQRQQILADNPVLAARFYERRLRLLLKHLIYGGAPVFGKKIVDHWYRIEFQFRGSPHAHCIFWLEESNIPDHVTSQDHTALFELAELAGCTVHSRKPDGFDASGMRVDPSPTSFDPWDDYSGAFRPPKYQDYVDDMNHVARRDAIVDGEEDALEADLYALEVAFQQHVCIKNFCTTTEKPECKRRYPRACTEHTMLTKDRDKKGRYRASIQTPRNHRWLVPFNRHLLQAWRGNVDVQVITDPKGAAAYATAIACYSTKPDTPDNKDVENAMTRALQAAHESGGAAKTLLSKATNAVLGQTPICAQRAAWYALGFDFVSASREVRCVNVPRPPATRPQAVDEYVEAVKKKTPSGDLAVMHPRQTLERNRDTDPAFARVDQFALGALVEDYTKRPADKDDLTLREFVQQYDREYGGDRGGANARNERIKCGNAYYRKVRDSNFRVVRVTPYVAANVKNDAFAWHVLVMDTAWRSLIHLIQEGETITAALERQMPHVAEHARNVVASDAPDDAFAHIEEAEVYIPDPEHMYDNGYGDGAEQVQDPADVAALEAMRIIDESFDDQADRAMGTGLGRFTADATFGEDGPARFFRKVGSENKIDRSDFLKNLSDEVEERRMKQGAERDVAGIELRDDTADNLEGRQREAYDHVTSAIADPNAAQLRVAVIGEAGTGKSKLIHAITRFTRDRFGPNAARVMAYMGIAAYNIHGVTIHSTMGFRQSSGRQSVANDPRIKSQETLDKLRRKFQDVKIIIVDEISLVDVKMLNAMDVVLKQIAENDKPFGGFHVVFMGDFYQLPPIDNRPLFKKFEDMDTENLRAGDLACLKGREAWLSVNAAFELDVNYRQRADTTGFIDILRTIRFGNAPTKAQLNKLRKRQCSLSEAFERAPDDALWVTHKNKARAAINDADLRRANQRGARTAHIWAHHSRVATPDGLTVDGQPAPLNREERRAATNHQTGDVDPVTLPSLLRLAIGSRVAITKNIDNTVGLYNGASGTLVALEYPEETRSEQLHLTYDEVVGGLTTPVPIALVQFDSIDHKDKNDQTAYSCDETLPGRNIVPIIPQEVTVVVNGVSYVRTQLPLVLARACTIHKAQGRTVGTCVYAPQRPFGAGQPYVAKSRVQLFDGLLIIKPDAVNELGLCEIDEDLFTAYQDQLAAVAVEMERLRALAVRPPGHEGTASRTRRRDTSEPAETDVPSPRRQRRDP
jgi:DNA replication protein DnaC